VAATLFVTTALLNKYVWGREEDMRPIISGALALAMTGFVVFVLVFVMAPFRLYDAERSRAERAERELIDLRESLNQKGSTITARIERPRPGLMLLHVLLTNNGPDDQFLIECKITAKRPASAYDDRINLPFTLAWFGYAGLERPIRRTQTVTANLGTITRAGNGFDVDFARFTGAIAALGQNAIDNFSHEHVVRGETKEWDLEFTAIPAALIAKHTSYALIFDGSDFQLRK